MFPTSTRILIVDDMPTIRDLVKNHLRAMGFKNTIEAEDGEQALKMLVEQNSKGEPVEMIICDWNMPKMKGMDLLKQIRSTAEWQNLPFIMLTSETDRESVTEAVLAGVSQYIVKPFAAKIFEDKLKTVWAKHNKPAA